jgi:hypothetical protein
MTKAGFVVVASLSIGVLLGRPVVAAVVRLEPDTLITEWRVIGPVPSADNAGVLKQNLSEADSITLGGRAYAVRTVQVHAKRKVGIGIIPEIPMWPEEADMISLPAGRGVYYAWANFRAERREPISLIIMTTGNFTIWLNGRPLGISMASSADLANPKRLDGLPVDQPYDQMLKSFLTVTATAQEGINTVLVRLDRRAVDDEPTAFGLRLNCRPPATPNGEEGSLGSGAYMPSPERPVCDRGDGTGIFSAATPPAFWDESAGLNIRWRTELGGPGKCGSIVVGNKVFTLAEPNVLICCDAVNGKILWQQANDHLELFPAEEARKVRTEWASIRGAYSRLFAVLGEYAWLTGMKGGGPCFRNGFLEERPLDDRPATKARAQELIGILKAEYGWEHPDNVKGSHEPFCYPPGSDRLEDFRARHAALARKYGFHISRTTHWQWRGFCNATPCSDGKYIYATFGTGQTVCYDLDGNRQWMAWSPIGVTIPRLDWWCAASVAPYLHGDLLITHIGNFLRVLDKRTGKTVWDQGIKYPNPSMSATVFGQSRPMQLGDTTVLISPDGRVYRLADGKILLDPDGWTLITGRTEKIINGKQDNRSVWNAVSAGTPAIHGDIAYFAFPNGLRALRYALDGRESVTVRQVWVYELSDDRVTVRRKGDKEQEALRSFSHEPAVFVDASPLYDPRTGRIWFGPHKSGEIEIIDAGTGKAIQEGTTPYWLPEGKGCAIAGDLVFAQTGHGVTHVYARQGSLTPVAENAVILPIVRDVRARTMTWAEYKQKWFDRGFEKIVGCDRTTGELFFHGDTIYMRTDTALVCIGAGT